MSFRSPDQGRVKCLSIRKRLSPRHCLSRFLSSAFILAATTEELIKAVREGNIEVARALLKQRVDVNAPQGDGATALHWAVHLDDLKTAEFLLRAGAQPNTANDTGVTPLYLACMNRNAVMVDKLLAAGANPNAALLKGETVLMMCARSGSASAVKALLIHGADVNATEPVAQPDRVDVGGRPTASSGRRSPARSRSELPRPVACLSPDCHRRRNATCRPRRAELHRAQGWEHAAAVCREVG